MDNLVEWARCNQTEFYKMLARLMPREFERQDMAKLFNKKIKARFPILFKRALDFHLMKAKGRI